MFPEYNKAINEFVRLIIDLVKGKMKIKKNYIERMNETLENFINTCEENEDYLMEFAEILFSAYLSSVHIITEIHSILEYLKSIEKNKVILLNAMSVLELKPGKNLLKGVLRMTDLASNIYDEVKRETNIYLKNENSIIVPIYSIFSWK